MNTTTPNTLHSTPRPCPRCEGDGTIVKSGAESFTFEELSEAMESYYRYKLDADVVGITAISDKQYSMLEIDHIRVMTAKTIPCPECGGTGRKE